MSQVMATNKIEVRYPFSQGYISSHWIETGEFLGYGKTEVLDCDTEQKRRLIVTLGWHLDRPWEPHPFRILGTPPDKLQEFRDFDLPDSLKTYDHTLTVDEMWKEIEQMASECGKIKESPQAVTPIEGIHVYKDTPIREEFYPLATFTVGHGSTVTWYGDNRYVLLSKDIVETPPPYVKVEGRRLTIGDVRLGLLAYYDNETKVYIAHRIETEAQENLT